MPIKQAAKKAMRQTAKRLKRNTVVKAELHSLRVKLRKLSTAGKIDEAKEVARAIATKMDKAVAKGILKKNTVSRLKSRIASKVNSLKK